MRAKLAAVLLASTLVVTGCASICRPAPPEAAPGMVPELVLPAEGTGSVAGLVNYNPLATQQLTKTWIYEPLMILDSFSCEMRPWLATGYEWTTPTQLRFTIRDGVRWSDGTDFTVDDVVWNIQYWKQYPGADAAGVWTDTLGGKATGVRAEGDQVIIDFDAPAPNKLEELVKRPMLPRHIWGQVGDITTYIDEQPVGTGPYVVGGYNGRRLALNRNPDYWQADQIKVERLVLEGQYEDPNAAALKLRNGDLDVFTGDIPNPDRSVKRNPNTDYYYAPAGVTVVTPNLERKPFDDVRFREALAYGIDKEQATLKATYGVMKPASQSMLKIPVQAADLPEKYRASQGYIPYDREKAAQLLDAAGYRLDADGRRTDQDGKPISLTFSLQAGFIDYIALADTVTRNWRDLGIDIKMVTTDPDAVTAQKKSGDFDVVLEYVGGGCTRSREWGTRLDSSQINTDKSKDLLPNVSRYRSPAVDKIIADMEATTDPTKIRAASDQLVDVWMTEFPVIALNYAPSRLVYRNATTTGWPDADHPYPVDNMLYVMTQIRPR
ncbi:MAG TPA: ABC transporter substrate-binding protein [Microlunatus sp.]|nr:ABC transporter substrate-binding protein [Microlunatus sp.]